MSLLSKLARMAVGRAGNTPAAYPKPGTAPPSPFQFEEAHSLSEMVGPSLSEVAVPEQPEAGTYRNERAPAPPDPDAASGAQPVLNETEPVADPIDPQMIKEADGLSSRPAADTGNAAGREWIVAPSKASPRNGMAATFQHIESVMEGDPPDGHDATGPSSQLVAPELAVPDMPASSDRPSTAIPTIDSHAPPTLPDPSPAGPSTDATSGDTKVHIGTIDIVVTPPSQDRKERSATPNRSTGAPLSLSGQLRRSGIRRI